MSIQWYPGHMAKAKEKIKEKLNLIDVVIELLDARIPKSSRDPDLNDLIADKKRIIALNKKDLASKEETAKWINYLVHEAPTLALNSLQGQGVKKLLNIAQNLMKEELEKLVDKGQRKRKIRLMIIGIPNVGKSQLINQLSKKGRAKTGNRPGVTVGQQWIKLNKGFELLDTPGILAPKFEDDEVGVKLALCGAIKDSVVDNQLLAYKLVEILKEVAPQRLKERFKLDFLIDDTYQLVAEIAKKRGCLQSGARVDRNRVSNIILKEFREGKFGFLTLETVDKVKAEVKR